MSEEQKSTIDIFEECRSAISNRTQAIKNFIIVKGKQELKEYKNSYKNYKTCQENMFKACYKALEEIKPNNFKDYTSYMQNNIWNFYEECSVFQKIEKDDLNISADLKGHSFTAEMTKLQCYDYYNGRTFSVRSPEECKYFSLTSVKYEVDGLNEPLKTCGDLIENATLEFFLN